VKRGRMVFVSKELKYLAVFNQFGHYTGQVVPALQTKGSTYRNPERATRPPRLKGVARRNARRAACQK
jgi:hypothetical protein